MKIYLGAVVDGDLLHGTAEVLLRRKEVLKVPVMMGVTNHEFGWILPQVIHPPGLCKKVHHSCCLWQSLRCFVFDRLLLWTAELRPPGLGERHEQGVGAGCGEHVQSCRGEHLCGSLILSCLF